MLPNWRRLLLCALGAIAVAISSRTTAACTVGKLAEFPVAIIDGVPSVPVTVNGRESRFRINSGFFFSQIDASQITRFGLKGKEPTNLTATRLGGKEATLSVVTVKDFKVAGIALPNSDFIVSSTSSQSDKVASAAENDIPGSIGQNILGAADVEYDLPDGFVRLMKAKDCGNNNLAYWAGDKPYSIMEIEGLDQLERHVAGALFLNGKRFRAIFNTGMPHSIVSLEAAARLGLAPGDPRMVAKECQYVCSGQSWVGSFDSVKLGEEEIRQTHLLVAKLGLPDIDAIIGADFFRAHRVYVATGIHRLFFTYTGGKPFDL